MISLPNLSKPPTTPTAANMSYQRFCLRWNNHQSNLLSVFDQLLHDESFVDVTLAVEGQLLKAHKMVLSACSPYFQALFVNHPDKHPIVILKDVPYNDMRSLLDFMYRGEVSVDQDRLTAFLKVAESLRIKGLTEVNEEKCDSITSSLTANQNANLQRLQQNKQSQQQQQQHQQQQQQLQQSQQPKQFNALNMLGNALLQPKRKRGRPRKLSGSSNGTPGADDFDRSDSLVQGSPEMLEVKMGMDGFTGNHSDTSSKDKEDENENSKLMRTDNGGEPIAGTSKGEYDNVKSENEFQASDTEIYYEESCDTNYLDVLPESVTLKVITTPKYHQESVIITPEAARNMISASATLTSSSLQTLTQQEQQDQQQDDYEKMETDDTTTGVHFLTDDESNENYERKKNELLEYIMRDDGSVVCKLCGELLQSRTHWYRHKYKFHVNNMVNPAPLFKCKHCNVFFKSRKGYMGHIASRHTSETTEAQTQPQPPPQPVVINHEDFQITIKEEVEMADVLPKNVNHKKKQQQQQQQQQQTVSENPGDWEEQRVKEEKLVAAIIDRVRKECEAQGSAVTRRGYSRRSTVMMNST